MRIQRFQPAMTRRLWLVALGVAVAPLFAAQAFAENFNLDSIDFMSNGDKTDIVLHTGSIVPVDKVQVTPDKMILEIDQINAGETIRTNFSGATNISHVIMQPLNDHRIRMTIRGEHLGDPSIAFLNHNGTFTADNPNYQGKSSDDKLAQDTATALHAVQENGMQAANLDAKADATALSSSEKSAADLDNAPLPADDHLSATVPPALEKSRAEDLTPLSPLSLSEPTGGHDTNFFDAVLKPAMARNYEPYIPFGLLGLLIVGLGVFVVTRIRRFRRSERQLEDFLQQDEQPMAAGLGKQRNTFRDMASAYRHKHARLELDLPASEAPLASKKSGGSDLIGLGGLKQMDLSAQQPPPQPESAVPANKQLETLLAAMQAAQAPKKPIPTSAPKKQAVGQYLKNQPQAKPKAGQAQAPVQNQTQNKAMNQPLMQAQAQRRQVQQDTVIRAPKASPAVFPTVSANAANPVNRASAARKQSPVTHPSRPQGNPVRPQVAQAAGQGPLPGNPEVLNFLRNVADLMEKDGKTGIAKSIHKNLGPQNLGAI